MSKFVSIKKKFIVSVMAMIAVVFVAMFIVLMILNLRQNRISLDENRQNITESIVARGTVLVRNNSTALRRMVNDFAITDIRDLVTATVSGDEDIVRGIYMTAESAPWVIATSENPSGEISDPSPLIDSVSKWVVQTALYSESDTADVAVKQFTDRRLESKYDVMEFAFPVVDDGEILGYIRYTFSTLRLDRALEQAERAAVQARNMILLSLLLIMVAAAVSAYVILSRLTERITHPLASLMDSAKIISEGNYGVVVPVESNDEIGNLAHTFDEMRIMIKRYTESLQDIIDDKMRQVKDILNNIDQGLLTVDFDGVVGQEYSLRSNEILNVEDVASSTIFELLRLDSKGEKAFDTWVKLLKTKHDKQRWSKLEKLAPVHSLEYEVANGDEMETRYVTVSYQKVFDKDGNFSKLMLLTKDETEKRKKEEMMELERLRHENEMKTILGIANTPETEMVDFAEDTSARIKRIMDSLQTHYKKAQIQRESHPNEDFVYEVSNEEIEALYRDFHTLKGNGGSYGFDMLSQLAHQAEDALEELKPPVANRRVDSLGEMISLTAKMQECYDEIMAKMKLIYGSEETVFARIPVERVEYVQKVAHTVANTCPEGGEIMQDLLQAVDVLSWEPLKTLARKYQKVADKAARTVGKEICFSFIDGNKMVPNTIFSGMDEPLLHIIRNAVAHGIESDEERAELSKSQGSVSLAVDVTEEERVFTVSDDGRGINRDAVLNKALERGLIKEADALKMSDNDVYELLFHSGFSTASGLNEVAGRGVGLDVVKGAIEKMNGTIEISSVLGKGTAMKITVPL